MVPVVPHNDRHGLKRINGSKRVKENQSVAWNRLTALVINKYDAAGAKSALPTWTWDKSAQLRH
jgi:hypothetical protein